MALSISLFCVCAVGILASTLFNLRIKLGKIHISLYWVIPVVIAIVLFATKGVSAKSVLAEFSSDTATNPLKILTLFISMTAISVYLDEIGFFKWLANAVVKKAGTSQFRLFVLLYVTTSILTVFTSNDVIILTFTPFICYFAKNCDINPVPYIVSEFVGANTWSMFLMIGNPTNIYLATSYGINFVDYIAIMALPTLLAGIVSFVILYIMFAKELKTPFKTHMIDASIDNKPCLVIGLIGLFVCTIMLAISSYIGVEMWIVALCSALFVILGSTIATLAQKKSVKPIGKTILRLPWQLVPFLLSMFVVVLSLDGCGITQKIATSLQHADCALTFGTTSALFANLMNNIPMSVLFSHALKYVSQDNAMGALYGSIIGSNIGALLTPICALAAIMWNAILKSQNVKFTFVEFVWRGCLIGIPSLLVAIGGLKLMLLIVA